MARTDRQLLRETIRFAREHRGLSWLHFGAALALLVLLLSVTALDVHPVARAGASFLAGLLAIRMFILYHDFAHGAILRGSRLAAVVMNAYGILTLNPPSPWRRSHDYHHAHNTKILGSSIGSYPVMTTEAYAKAGRRERFQYAVARHPLTIFFGYFTVFLYGMCLRPFLTNPRQHADCAAALAVHGGLVAALGMFAPDALLFTLLLPLFVAASMGAYLFYAQHNFPDVKLKPRSEWTHVFAALHSSSYMPLGPLLRWFTGNIGYHHIHHLNPRIPFYRLPAAMAALPELQSPGTTSLGVIDIWRCLRLKLWDAQRNRMVPFDGETGGAAPRRAGGDQDVDRTRALMPGGDLVRQGIEDLARGVESVGALLVSIGAARLGRAGVAVPPPLPDAEHRLYLLLAGAHGDDAHSRYNALIRRLVSFERALECAS